jgi:hypothetical protein
MTPTLIAISAAYAVLGVLLLSVGLTSPLRWWIKAAAIVVTSVFFVEAFFATKGLLGWPGSGRLPARFQLLWTRVVEPDPKIHDAGSIFLWVEEVDENNVPISPRTRPLRAAPCPIFRTTRMPRSRAPPMSTSLSLSFWKRRSACNSSP